MIKFDVASINDINSRMCSLKNEKLSGLFKDYEISSEIEVRYSSIGDFYYISIASQSNNGASILFCYSPKNKRGCEFYIKKGPMISEQNNFTKIICYEKELKKKGKRKSTSERIFAALKDQFIKSAKETDFSWPIK